MLLPRGTPYSLRVVGRTPFLIPARRKEKVGIGGARHNSFAMQLKGVDSTEKTLVL